MDAVCIGYYNTRNVWLILVSQSPHEFEASRDVLDSVRTVTERAERLHQTVESFLTEVRKAG